MPQANHNATSARLLSLDVMRGLIMLLLAGESCLLYEHLLIIQPEGKWIQQFFHEPWHGLRFWDLVQPAFMTMAGAALYISFYYKTEKNITWKQNLKHIFIRCIKLFICGTALHCVYAGRLVWELWNVLTQLSVTTIIAYSIIKKPVWCQLSFSVALLLLTELLYRFVLMQGYEHPFVSGHNFGNWMDVVLMHKINTDGWVAINIIPTAAHTIWGVLAGKLLISKKTPQYKIKVLLLAAAACLILGYGLDLINVTPIIKRISTSSFVFASAGWVFIILAFLYWLTDVKGYRKYAWVFLVTGMNAIFIYLFFETVGSQWLNKTVAIFVKGAFNFTAINDDIIKVLSSSVTLFAEWYLCYWLYKKKIFFKL